MTLQEIKDFSLSIYYAWLEKGCPEASASLNDGNRKIIKDYMKLYPKAKGYKNCEGFCDLSEKCCNFFCDWVFNGTDQNLRRISRLEREFIKTRDFTHFNYALEQADGICLIWS